jgi:hypothetical protein
LPSYKYKSYENIFLKKYSSSSNNYLIDKPKSLSFNKTKIKPKFYSHNIKSKSPEIKDIFLSPNKQFIYMKPEIINTLKLFTKELNKPPFIPITTYNINNTFINKTMNDYGITKIDEQAIYLKIINTIIYVSYPVFKNNLEKCFDKFIEFIKSNNITDITIVIDTSTIYSSIFWTTQHFFHYLNKKSIKLNIDFINNLSDIKKKTGGYYLILNDCINEENTLNIKKLLSKNHFFIVSPYIIKHIHEKIEEQQKINTNIHLFNVMVVSPLYSTLTKKEIEIITNSAQLKLYLYPMLNKHLIYFDHYLYYGNFILINPLINKTIPDIYLKHNIQRFKFKR